MRSPIAALLAFSLAGLLACGNGEIDVAARPPTGIGYAGLYDVEGWTTTRADGERRRIEGKLIIAQPGAGEEASAFTATFNMRTEFVTPEGPIRADVIGSGTGSQAGDGLVGSAETQLLMAAIPGLDPKFPWIPGRLGPRVVSDFEMAPHAEGGFQIAIETRGAPGEQYEPTLTTLRAVRAGAVVESTLPPAPAEAD